MKFYRAILYLLPLCSIDASALDLTELGERMKAIECYGDSADYDVLLASLAEPVSYSISLTSNAAEGDTLSPCKYFIGWQLPAPSGMSTGFSAYFDGSHFRFRDKRLQEYHYADSPMPFAPMGQVERGVQRQVQFADLLPQFIGEQLCRMATDDTYTTAVTADTLVSGCRSIVVEGVRRINGADASEYTYIIDADTYLPHKIELENNPGQIGEQSVVINYHGLSGADCRLDLDRLMAMQPEAFEKYRDNTFSLATLAGRPMPRIVAPTPGGDRYMHEREEPFSVPTIFAFVDATIGDTSQMIADVRKAIDSMPFQTDVVWAFLNHRAEDIDGIITASRPGETVLLNAGGAARNCGVGSIIPTLVFASTDGRVADVQIGYNQDMPSIVIQKITNTKYAK